MIRQFWVENYLSVKDRQTIDFTAKNPSSVMTATMPDDTHLYKLGIFYGANASGKSNILVAIDEIFHILISPSTDSTKEISRHFPFMLTKEMPVKMFVSFYANGIRYDYELEFNNRFILKENLFYYPNKSRSLFYNRKFIGEGIQAKIEFGPSLKLHKATQTSIIENTLNNHSVLSVWRKNSFKEDIEPFIQLHKYITEHYHDIDGDSERGITEELSLVSTSKKKHQFFDIMLRKADLNIMNFRLVTKERNLPAEAKEQIANSDIPETFKERLLNPVEKSVLFTNESDEGSFEVPLSLQSMGTIKYIQRLSHLYDMITANHVYLLDELGEDLHHDLLMYYLNVFLFNSDQSQLIFTSQETALLSEDTFNENRGTVWFVDKNPHSASSEYSRGDSFGLHKNMSLHKSYEVGRLGAKPDFGSFFIDLE